MNKKAAVTDIFLPKMFKLQRDGWIRCCKCIWRGIKWDKFWRVDVLGV